jgi:iron(III) transport system ATP-binding protein
VIRVAHVSKRFRSRRDDVLALDDVTFDVEPGSFFTLLGPSGCGKSTLLRCVAGLETPDQGEIEIGGRLVFSSATGLQMPPSRRRIGMVFQSYAVWPHMTVFGNVAFPLEVQGRPQVRERVMRALTAVGLEPLADRYASLLSGGQQQRVALARAIVGEPDVLLLDEPLSNLDATLREQMRGELRNLQQSLHVTTLYVTHDQTEALSMSDRIAVMRDGRFVETGSPEDLYHRPTSSFTAHFVGGANILPGTVEAAAPHSGLTVVATKAGPLWSVDASPPGPVAIFIRPEKIRLAAAGDQAGRNVLACRVRSQRFAGDSTEMEVTVAGAGADVVLRCKTSQSVAALKPGEPTRIVVDPADVRVLRSEPGDLPLRA